LLLTLDVAVENVMFLVVCCRFDFDNVISHRANIWQSHQCCHSVPSLFIPFSCCYNSIQTIHYSYCSFAVCC